MSENNYFSPVFVNDINERLEKNFSVRRFENKISIQFKILPKI